MSAAAPFRAHGKEIARAMLVLGATSYGGPAMMGVMQAELQDKRQWLTKERFVEGLSLVSLLPGATATMLAIFLSYTRGGWWGGPVGGLCFVVPAFVVMLALAVAIAGAGVSWLAGSALPVTPATPAVNGAPTRGRLAGFFFQVGALTFGGGLTMIAFIQQHVVDQMRWLTPPQFIDGLALGQFTPGPVLMVAAGRWRSRLSVAHPRSFTPAALRLAIRRAGFSHVQLWPGAMSTGDPYATGVAGLRALKRFTAVVTLAVARCSGRRRRWSPSLLAVAVNTPGGHA